MDRPRLGHFRWCAWRLSEVTAECDARPPTNNMDIDRGPRASTRTLRVAAYSCYLYRLRVLRGGAGTASLIVGWMRRRYARSTSFHFSDTPEANSVMLYRTAVSDEECPETC